MRTRPRLLVLLVIGLLAGLGLATPAASATAPYCGITWGSLAKSSGVTAPGDVISGVRAGRHACYDRLVVDLRGDPAFGSYDVRYVPVVRQDGSGFPVPLRGGADLQIVVRAPAYDDMGAATYLPAHPTEVVGVAGYRTFRQVAWAGSFEGQTTLGLGVRARLPFRVLVLPTSGGTRVVVDVAHRW